MTAVAALAKSLTAPTANQIMDAVLSDLRFLVREFGQPRRDALFEGDRQDATNELVARLTRRIAIKANDGADNGGLLVLADHVISSEDRAAWGHDDALDTLESAADDLAFMANELSGWVASKRSEAA